MSEPPDFVVNEPIILIYIGRSIGIDLSVVYPADVYAAVKEWWRGFVEPSEADDELVLARNRNRVLGAFRVKRWVVRQDGKRWGFIGEPAEISAQMEYVGKRVPNAYRSQNPVRYLKVGD